MGVDAGTPPGLFDRIRQLVRDEVAKLLRSGLLRNASISEGGLTIRGGFLRLVAGAVDLFYVGPVAPNKADGTAQQGWIVRRADGTNVLFLRDAIPTDAGGALQQALNWYDRTGNVVLADDTNGGVGLARPWLSGGFGRTRFTDFGVGSTSATFETLWDQRISKQQPRLEVAYRASMDTSATTGETRVLVNGVQLGTTQAETFSVATHFIGPLAVAGNHMDDLLVEIQGRRTSTTGTLKVEPLYWKSRQT